MATWVGFDVSKATLDIGWECEGRKSHKQFPNNRKGFPGDPGGGAGGRKLPDGGHGHLLLQCSA